MKNLSKQKNLNLMNILFILFLLPSSIKSWDYMLGGHDWEDQCKRKSQSPIDISMPFTYAPADLEFFYNKASNTYNMYNDGNNLIVEGDFGYIKYNKEIYISTQMYLFSPSQHTVGNHRLPLEVQIIHKSADSSKTVAISIMHKKDPHSSSSLLEKLGFANENLKNMAPFKSQLITQSIDLNKFLNPTKNFFYYGGREFFPPCEDNTVYFVGTDIVNIGDNQLENFPDLILNNNKIIQYRENREIFLTCPMDEINRKVELAHKIMENNMADENAKNLIKINKILSEIDLNNKEAKDFQKQFKEQQKMLDVQPDEASKELNLIGKEENDKKLESAEDIKNEIDKKLEMIKQIEEEKLDALAEKMQDRLYSSANRKSNVPFDKVKAKAIELNSAPKVDFNVLGEDEHDKDDQILPETKIYFDAKTLDKLNEKYKDIFLQISKHRYNNSPMTMIKLKKAKSLLNQQNKSFIEVDTKMDYSGFGTIKSTLENIENKLDEDQRRHERSKDILSDQINSALGNDEPKDKLELANIEEKLVEIAKRLDQHQKKYSQQNERKMIRQQINKALEENRNRNIKEDVTLVNFNLFNLRGNQGNLGGMKKPMTRQQYDQEVKEIEKQKMKLMKQNEKIQQQSEKIQLEKKYLEQEQKKINNQIEQNKLDIEKLNVQLELQNLEEAVQKQKEQNQKNTERQKVQIKETPKQVINIEEPKYEQKPEEKVRKPRIIQKEQQQREIQNEEKAFVKTEKKFNIFDQPQDVYQISTKLMGILNPSKDIKLIDMLLYIFNRAKDEFGELDANNKHNSTYINYLTDKNKVKLSLTTLAAILVQFIELPRDIPIEEQKEMLYKYTEYLIKKQNTYYLDHYLVPLELIKPNEIADFSYLLKLIVSKKTEGQTQIDLLDLMLNLFNKYPIVPIDPMTEEISTYVNDKTGKGEIDYLAYYYLRSRLDKKLEKNTKNFGDRGIGKLATNLQDDLHDGETELKIVDQPIECRNILFQSPINIKPPFLAGEFWLRFAFESPKDKIELINDAYKIRVKSDFGTFSHKDNYYKINEIQIHLPSEHTFGPEEKRFLMELQIIGKDEQNGKVGALAVPFEYGEENVFLSGIGFKENNAMYAYKLRNGNNVEIKDEEFLFQANLRHLWSNDVDISKLHYYEYIGSLTSPECIDNVEWFVLFDPVKFSRVQAQYFPVLHGARNNVKRTQPINGRVIKAM